MPGTKRVIAVFLFSVAFLLLELSLSRIFSVISFYHYAYMAISLALFGMAFGGVLLFLRPSLIPAGRSDEQSAVLAALYAAYTLLALNIISNTDFDPFRPLGVTFGSLVILFLICAVPFLIAGVILGHIFTRSRERIGLMYGANLLGSGAGCMLVIPAMNILGAPGAVITAAFFSCCAAIAFQPGRSKARIAGYGVFALLLLILSVTSPSTGRFDLKYSKGHNFENADVLYSKWNSFSRVLVLKDYPRFLGIYDRRKAFQFYNWGLSSKYDGPMVEGRSLLIDDLAGSPLIHYDGDLEEMDFLRYDITSLGYYLKEEESPDVLIIGTGGGRDVLTALGFDAGSITAVEINPLIIDVTQDLFADFTGKPYSHPKVELHVDEGRSFVARSKKQYDIIQIPLVDTWAATASGAFSLSENNLYTVEAFGEYFGHLAPGGMLAVSRYVFDEPKQSLRVLSLFRAYCERNGIENPEKKCAVVAFDEYKYFNVGTIIMKRDDLTEAEMGIIRDVSREMGFKILWMPDGGVYPHQFSNLLYSDDLDEYVSSYPFDISPATDDRPFFFHLVRPGQFLRALFVSEHSGQPYNYMAIFTLMLLLFIVIILIIAGILIPLYLSLHRRGMRIEPKRANQLLYFALTGWGFMLFEMGMVQKFILFLGPPIYSLSVVIFTLLVFTGIGAFCSDKVAARKVNVNPSGYILLLAVIIAGFNFILTPMFESLIGLGIFWRCLVSVALLAPLGFLLGFPFPLGVRLMGDAGKAFIPYAYGLNGAFSVLGSVTSLVFALSYGFSFNLFLAIGLYLLAAVAARTG